MLSGPLDCELECKDPSFDQARELAIQEKIRQKLQPAKKRIRTFIGPVKVILISTSIDEYRKRVWGNSFVTMAYFAIGAMLMVIYMYCVSFRLYPMDNLHVLLFTMSTQVLSPAALLCRHVYNGAAYLAKPKHKKFDFFSLKIVSIGFFAVGVFCSLMSDTMRLLPHRVWTTEEFSPHAFAGMISGLLMAGLDAPSIVLCYSFNYKRTFSRLAVVLCIPSFLASVVCLILAIIKESFLTWLPSPLILPFLLLSILYYTFLSCYDPIRNMLPYKRAKYTFYN